MLGLHDAFHWFISSQDLGAEKPNAAIFRASLQRAQFWRPGLQPVEVLHIGDSLEADFCGARAAGHAALLLDRSSNPKVQAYQDWLSAPDYPGKSEADIRRGTVKDLSAVVDMFVQAGVGAD